MSSNAFIKSWERASQLDRKPSHRVLVGLGFFFPAPRWKNPGTGHGIIKIESVQKKLRSGRGLTNGLKNSIIEVLEGVNRNQVL